MEQIQVALHLHAYLRHLTHPQVMLYLSINGEQFRIEKTKGNLPNIVQVSSVRELLDDAKLLSKHNPYYELTTVRDRMPVTNDELLRLIAGLVHIGLMRVRDANGDKRGVA